MTTSGQPPATPARGVDVPPPGRWWFDPDHTRVEFIARYLTVTNVRGRFRLVTGAVTLGHGPDDDRVDVTVAVASLDSGSHLRDERLRGPEFLDVARYPLARFRSERIQRRGHEATVSGQLQLGAVTRPLELQIAYLATGRDPWDRTTAQFFGSAELHRSAWGVDGNVFVPRGGLAIGDRVRLELEVQLLAEPPRVLPPLPSSRPTRAGPQCSPEERP